MAATGDLTLRSGYRVVLRDGFRVAAGGRFVAAVDPTIAPETPAPWAS